MEEIIQEKKGRGGARKGAGRKKTEGERHMYTIPKDVAQWIKEHGEGTYITKVMREIMCQSGNQ